MTEGYDNRNRGVLFRVDEADKRSDKSPDYRGTINWDGTEMSLSGWVKTSAKGTRYMSLAIRPRDEPVAKSRSRADEFDDDVPF